MPSSYNNLLVHFVWVTLQREPIIRPEWEKYLYLEIELTCKEIKCILYEVNGTSDHIHVLLRLPATMSAADAAHRLKGASSRRINNKFNPESLFRWQSSYAAFSVDMLNFQRVQNYIKNQKEHHNNGSILNEWEYRES